MIVHQVPDSTRRRLLAVLFLGSGLARTGFIAAVSVAALVAEDLLDSASLAGVPAAASTIGVAVGTAPIAALMARRGRRSGISFGLGVAALGALVAAAAIGLGSYLVFVAGMFALGFGSAGDRLSRYAASDISMPERRSFSISLIVWAGTIGAVLGPLLLQPVATAAEGIGLESLVGPLLFASFALAVAAVVALIALRPDPLSFVEPAPARRAGSALASLRPLLVRPPVRYAITALVAGQVVMVLIMTMTPVHIRRAGDGIAIVGLVIGAHTFGMFAVSPLTGLLADRIGRIPVMVTGQVVLVASAFLAAFAGGNSTALLVTSLFLLGLGWNFGFVAGSAYLTEGAPVTERVALQGFGDTLIWTSGALASFSSGLLFQAGGYALLCLLGSALVVAPAALFVRYRRALLQPQAA
jgi:MFS family permease